MAGDGDHGPIHTAPNSPERVSPKVPLPVSVVVVTRNASATLLDCLRSVVQNQPAEILVVDGDSTDSTLQIAQEYADRIMSDEGSGLAHARQLGAEQANQDYVAYVDADVVLSSGALGTMLAELQEKRYCAISARMRPGKTAAYWERATHEHVNILLARKAPLGLAASLFPRDIILKYRFDPQFPRVDDVALSQMLLKAGSEFGLSSAWAYHYHKSNLREFRNQRFVNGRAKAQYLWKYGLHHLSMWPPLTSAYMVCFSLVKRKAHLLPYFVIGGAIETAGIIKGFWELLLTQLGGGESRHRLT